MSTVGSSELIDIDTFGTEDNFSKSFSHSAGEINSCNAADHLSQHIIHSDSMTPISATDVDLYPPVFTTENYFSHHHSRELTGLDCSTQHASTSEAANVHVDLSTYPPPEFNAQNHSFFSSGLSTGYASQNSNNNNGVMSSSAANDMDFYSLFDLCCDELEERPVNLAVGAEMEMTMEEGGEEDSMENILELILQS